MKTRRTPSKSLVAAVFLIAAFCTVQVRLAMGADELPGKAGISSETRSLSRSIDTIEITAPIDLIVRQSATPSMVIKAEQSMLEKIRTSQEGRTLSISMTPMQPHFSRRPMRIEIGLPALQSLRVAGSGDADLSGFSGERFKLVGTGSGDIVLNAVYRNVEASLSGSGDLVLHAGTADSLALSMSGSGDTRIDGRVQAFTVSMKGSGDLKAADLATEVMTLALTGSGDASVTASRAATVISRGSGDVIVAGNPSQKVISRSGSGAVTFR